MIRALKNSKLPTELPFLEAIWIYAKRSGLFLIVVGVVGGVLGNVLMSSLTHSSVMRPLLESKIELIYAFATLAMLASLTIIFFRMATLLNRKTKHLPPHLPSHPTFRPSELTPIPPEKKEELAEAEGSIRLDACSNCGRELRPYARFCSHCGVAVSHADVQQPPIQPPKPH